MGFQECIEKCLLLPTANVAINRETEVVTDRSDEVYALAAYRCSER